MRKYLSNLSHSIHTGGNYMTQILTTIALLGAMTAAEGRALVERITPRSSAPTIAAAHFTRTPRGDIGAASAVETPDYALAANIRDRSRSYHDTPTSAPPGSGPKPPKTDYDFNMFRFERPFRSEHPMMEYHSERSMSYLMKLG
jgi:hypothetical protein